MEIISKEEFDELMSIEGKIIGAGIKPSGEFILKEEGEEGTQKNACCAEEVRK